MAMETDPEIFVDLTLEHMKLEMPGSKRLQRKSGIKGLFMRTEQDGMIFISSHATDELVFIGQGNHEIGHTMGSLLPHQRIEKRGKIIIIQYRDVIQKHFPWV